MITVDKRIELTVPKTTNRWARDKFVDRQRGAGQFRVIKNDRTLSMMLFQLTIRLKMSKNA